MRGRRVPAHHDPAVDIDVCRAVRRGVGDAFTVMLDSTWAYQYPEALRVGKVAEELRFYWYEDPLADDDLLSYVKLKQHLSIPILATPLIRRIAWHVRRIGGQFDRRLVLTLLEGTVAFLLIIAVAVTLLEKPVTMDSLFDSINWAVQTLLGAGDSTYVASPGGRILSWVLILFGIAILGIVTGALVALVIDFLLKEGQGLGAAGPDRRSLPAGATA